MRDPFFCGDEFAILLRGECDIEAAEAVADKVLAAASQPFDIDGRSVRVSASIGVAVMARTDAGLHELLSRADGLLYRAKAAGRGRQVSSSVELARSDTAAPAQGHVSSARSKALRSDA
jgi:diguanylate cyclase (GGDEF)-like protein